MYSAVHSGALQGVCAYMVSVEVDIARGLPAFLMVGSLSTEVRESRERVTVALPYYRQLISGRQEKGGHCL